MNVVAHRAMKAHRKNRKIVAIILNLGCRWRRVLSFKYQAAFTLERAPGTHS